MVECLRDIPQNLEDSGGWLNEEIIGLFGDYVRLIYQTFGDKVKYWITINEPYTYCYYGYDQGTFAPGVKDPATGPYDCVHSLIKAHALAYQIYKEEFSKKQQGKVGISLDNFWQEPADPKSVDDVRAAEQSYVFRVKYVSILKLYRFTSCLIMFFNCLIVQLGSLSIILWRISTSYEEGYG